MNMEMNFGYIAMNLFAGSHLPNDEHNSQSCKLNLLTLDVPGTRLPISTHGQVSVPKFVQPALVQDTFHFLSNRTLPPSEYEVQTSVYRASIRFLTAKISRSMVDQSRFDYRAR